MSSHKQPFLRVIPGDGDSSAGARHPLVLATTGSPSSQPPPQGDQLALPGVFPACAIIGVSPAALFTRDLADILSGIRARHFIDMRLAVEFGSLGLSRRSFEAIVRRVGLVYGHARALAHQDHELTWNPAAMWSRFRERLRQDPARSALRQLRDVIDDGPVVLLSESPRHEDSERHFVVEALYELRPGFAHHYIDPAH